MADTLLAMITTAGHSSWPSDYAIEDLRPTGLRIACVVRWKLFTLDNRVLGRRIGLALWAIATDSPVAPLLDGSSMRSGPLSGLPMVPHA